MNFRVLRSNICPLLMPLCMEKHDLKRDCRELEIIWPKVFKKSIPSKLDDLITVVPKFGEKFHTIGGLREEDIERLHNETNQLMRVLCCVRDEGHRMKMAMERIEMKRATPTSVPRKFRCQKCKDRPYLMENKCNACGYVRHVKNI